MTKTTFDFNSALKAIQSGQPITGSNGVLAPLVKQLTEAALSAELDTYLADNRDSGNRRNGYFKKTEHAALGSFEIETPHDRAGAFEPQLVKKHQTKLSEEIDNKIISLFSHGMSYRDFKAHIADIYGLSLSDGAITNITDQLIPQLNSISDIAQQVRKLTDEDEKVLN